jgi:hypothetical protein
MQDGLHQILEVPMRTWLAAAALAAASFVAAPAFAGVGVGDAAPEMQGKEFINTPKVTLKELRGRVLIYDIFRTW